ncbi:molybdenum cofactor guanylyltransferase [Halapricum hydrolyticum]|uniref:Probable molybdenum cofactor guanylyltransferase n=1 Tax=Halapricum hydrolyticum TaxID=2979991 RepID=A0AAE3IBX4_9EURY|nr:molybdenum cofactor guanylyltransferase [Halapricum hydrolyticum]MCU4717971.1 molybdenum cofactor guanylyltransferase [Halapricum hydrolyticum]MCU4727136.1 molybdenum cofactor guanylyltransferase [Halapricum hydrolyticum]
MNTRAGIVLAGGFARRFGERDKTLAEFRGRPLIVHAVEPLQAVVERVVVSCRREQLSAFETVLSDVDYRPDPTPDEGPLAGLDAALDGLEADTVAVTTADRPLVPAGLYRSLFESLSSEGIVIRADGIDQPVPAVFDAMALRTAVTEQRSRGTRRLRAALDAIEYTTITSESVEQRWGSHVLADVNTPADLTRLDEKT